MRVGCLGDIAFEVSADTVRTVSNVVWSGSANYSIHARHLSDGLVEFTGTAPAEISFDIVLSAYLGVNPMEDIHKIRDYTAKGLAMPLVIGSTAYGNYRWVIKSYKVKMQAFTSSGDLASATVSLSLIEYGKA